MSPDAAPSPRRRRLLIGLGILVLLAGGAVAVFFATREGNVSNPDVEFQAEASPTPTPTTAPGKAKPDPFAITWPMYGGDADRRRYFDAPAALKPPFKRAWTFVAGSLIEFPPALKDNGIYLLADAGMFFKLDKRGGKVLWKRKLGDLAASTPALADGMAFATVLERTGGGAGRVVALDQDTGRVVWSKDMSSRTESSPLVADGNVYLGTEGGSVFAFRQRDGKQLWEFRASGAVKGALALKDGKLVFGDYGGAVYAIAAATGKPVWEARTKGATFGLRSGRFYSTPAIAYGRVYIGNVDGYVYSFSLDDGELAWRTQTGGYVYAAPAIGPGPGGKPTVFTGSYDGRFYAMDARSGAVEWSFGGGSRISGPAQVLSDTVYFSDLGHRRVVALDTRTGKQVFTYPKGGFAPVITDGQTLFLTGYGALYALQPPRTFAKLRAERRAIRRAARAEDRGAARPKGDAKPKRKATPKRDSAKPKRKASPKRKTAPKRRATTKIPKIFRRIGRASGASARR